jgi:hypothetical protein
LRFACKGGITIVGGASKLLKYFEQKWLPKYIITYADRCWSTGNFYKRIGFIFKNYSPPGYWYMKDNEVFYRYKFAKHTLNKQLLIYDPDLSEWENMQNNGYTRFWDCGNCVYIKCFNEKCINN